ncbi:hypothetical protein ABDI30_17485 [Paenibacillus cisolokensis]|uniref:hypothetical protein n=1 Tax=Paenibacillus cisolokensis TaxID=1658519 RepID=UPI003D290CCF
MSFWDVILKSVLDLGKRLHRYYCVGLNLCKDTVLISLQKVKDSSILGIILLTSLILCYYIIWQLSGEYLYWSGFLTYIHEQYINFELAGGVSTDIAIIKTITKFIAFLVPISLTFLYFSYKEQKALAISTVSFTTTPVILYVLLCAATLILGTHLTTSIKTNMTTLTLDQINREYSGRILIWIILVILLVFQGWKMIFTHISNLHFRTQTDFAIKKIHKNLDRLIVSVTGFQRREFFNNACNNVDTIYQLLFLAIDKTMFNFYEVGLETWKKVLFRITNDGDQDIVKYVINQKESDFGKLYKSILSNHVTLIKKLLSANRFEDVNIALDILEQIQINSQKNSYYTALHELAFVSYKSEILDLFLSKLESILKRSKHANGNANEITTIYKQLLVLVIEDNDIKSLGKVIYSMMKNFNNIQTKGSKKGRIPVPVLNTAEQSDDLNECILYMILQSIVKSIELAHYACTGFLIKYLVTHFKWDFIKKVYGILIDNLITKQISNNPYLLTSNISNITVSFNFNTSITRYCCEKMSLLLFCQQKFALEFGAPVNYRPTAKSVINIEGIKNDIDYLSEKISKVGDKYGLLCVTHTVANNQGEIITFLKKTVNEVKKNLKQVKSG